MRFFLRLTTVWSQETPVHGCATNAIEGDGGVGAIGLSQLFVGMLGLSI